MEATLNKMSIEILRKLAKQTGDAFNAIPQGSFESLFWLQVYGKVSDAILEHPDCTCEDHDTSYINT